MGPITQMIPKALLECAGATLLEHLVDILRQNNIDEIILGVGYKHEKISSFVEKRFQTTHLTLVEVPSYEIGALETLVMSTSGIDQRVLICPVDMFAESSVLRNVINVHHEQPESIVTLGIDTSFEAGTPVSVDSEGRLTGIGHDIDESSISGTSAMVLVAEASFLKLCRECRKEGVTSIVQVLKEMQLRGIEIGTAKISGTWFDIDTVSALLDANRVFLEREHPQFPGFYMPLNDTLEFGDSLELNANVKMGVGVTINGPVFVAHQSTIGANSSIGPHVSLGRNNYIGERCTIADAVLFDSTTIRERTSLSRAVVCNNRVFTE